jgi:hypothetical protein
MFGTDNISALIGIVGVFLGFVFSFILEWWKKRILIKGYSMVLQTELKCLKEDKIGGLDDVIKGYNHVNGLVEKNIRTSLLPLDKDPQDSSDFLLRWSFRHKYAFLRNNLDKLYLLKPEAVTSMLKIYGWMEEFEQFRTENPKLLSHYNLEYVQNEIPKTLSLLKYRNF